MLYRKVSIMRLEKVIANRYGLIDGLENRIQGNSLTLMNYHAKKLVNELPAAFSNLKRGTKVREIDSGKIGRIAKSEAVEYDDGSKLYCVQFKGEHEPRLISKSQFRLI